MNTNTKTLEPVVASLFAYAKYSVLIYPQDIVSLNPSSGLSAEIWSRFSRLVCFNWVHNEVFPSFVLEILDLLMHEKNILLELTTPKYTICKDNIRTIYFAIKLLRNVHYACVWE